MRQRLPIVAIALFAALSCGRGDFTRLGETRWAGEPESAVLLEPLYPDAADSGSTSSNGALPSFDGGLPCNGLTPRGPLAARLECGSDAGGVDRHPHREDSEFLADAGAPKPERPQPDEEGAPESLCALGATVNSEFYPLRNGQPIPLLGGSQANLILALAVATKEVLDLDETRIVVSAASEFGSTDNGYILGGPSPRCDSATGCSLTNLNLSTEPLVADPFDLANLEVVVRATITLSRRPYCEVEVAGRLRRAD